MNLEVYLKSIHKREYIIWIIHGIEAHAQAIYLTQLEDIIALNRSNSISNCIRIISNFYESNYTTNSY